MPGNITRRGKNSYRLSVSTGFDSGGNRILHRKTIRAASMKEAELELAKFVSEVENPQYVKPSKMTFKEFSGKWLTEYAVPTLSERTVQDYRKHLGNRLIPFFGNMVLESITPFIIHQYYNRLRNNGRRDGKQTKLSEMTIKQIHLFLSSLFERAVKWGFIHDNPLKRVEAPKVKRNKNNAYDARQLEDIFKVIDGEQLKYKLIFTLAVTCGLRRGEILGLRWSDIEPASRRLHIRQASQPIIGKGVIFKEPKTFNSLRTVSIPEPIIGLLEQYRTEQDEHREKVGSLWQTSDLLFTQWDGTPMYPDSVSRWFGRLIKAHNLPHIRFHDLRHTAASMMISKGVDVKTVSGILGHADIKTTLNIYAHVFDYKKAEAAEKMAELIKLS